MIKNVYFDLDGTLIDSAPSIITSLKLTLKHFGYPIPDYSTLKLCVGPPFTYSFPNYLHVRDEDFNDAVAYYRNYYDNENGCLEAEVFEGIEGLLQALVKRGYCLFVCTSKPEPTARKILEHLGIAKYFTDICGATLDAKVDTKAEVINLCFKRAPWHLKEETVLIGDTKFDVLGAKEAGIDCVGITWGSGERAELEELGAVEVFDFADEVLDYIESN